MEYPSWTCQGWELAPWKERKTQRRKEEHNSLHGDELLVAEVVDED